MSANKMLDEYELSLAQLNQSLISILSQSIRTLKQKDDKPGDVDDHCCQDTRYDVGG